MAVFSAIAAAIGAIGSAIGSAVGAIGSALGVAGAGSGLAAVSGVVGLVGTGLSIYGQLKQQKGLKKAEALRLRQQNLEASRARRQTVRQAIIARATALSNATSQNAGESSGAAGGQGSIAAQAGSNIQGVNQGQSIGLDMFKANAMISSGQTLSSIGSGVQGLGNYLANNYEVNRRVFA